MKFLKVISVTFVILFLTFGCKTKPADLKRFGFEEEKYTKFEVEDLESTYSENAHVKLVVSSPEVIKYDQTDDSYYEFKKGILMTFYNPDLSIETSLTAEYAIYYDKKNIGRANKNVVITNKKGSILRTEELFLDEKKQKIYTQKPVSIVDADGSEIHGKGGFESNMSFTVYQFTDVSGNIPVVDTLFSQKPAGQ
jgi:LPS export ABC transporter protein LptC